MPLCGGWILIRRSGGSAVTTAFLRSRGQKEGGGHSSDKKIVSIPRLDPRWDPIREHPRFKALLVK